ncbi:hypothetical protein O181_068248 [Austropuccinia psidii MF-1]|uniref:Integrase catalytic domain-containing protein n=1 Tax=Austropuccinia psidii MF-1 TaxID=1389203 RepID=A0A9Q3I593_9BASI|nr:hypothetical protein [Austropuccinia psidii MF-1]
MNLTAVGIRVGKPPSIIDISDQLLAEIITSKLSRGYDNLKRTIYETRPLETIKVVSKIDDYIRDSYTTEFRQLKNRNKQKQKTKRQHYKKKKANSANTNQESMFEESYSSSEENPVVRYSKAFVTKCSAQSLRPYLDTAASSHMVGDKGAFLTYTRKDMSVKTANGLQTPVLGHGNVQFLSNNKTVTLHCLHVPDLAETLISMGKLWKSGFTICRTNNNLFSIKRGNSPLINGVVSNNRFILNMELCFPKPAVASIANKSKQLPYKGTLPRAKTPGHTIHSDLSGRISPPSIGGGNYYLKLTDDYSRFKSIYILKHKSDAEAAINDYVHKVERKHGSCVKVFVNDNGGEYLSSKLQDFLKSKGIKMQFTAPYSPKQNPISERGNRATSEKARALLFTSNLPSSFWGEVVVTSAFLENITLVSTIDNKTPFELWKKSKFDLSRLRTFGCRCYVNIPKTLQRGKFDSTSKRGIFLCYDPDKHNCCLMLENGKITKSHDVIFNEDEFPKPPEVHNFCADLTLNNDDGVNSIFTKQHNNTCNVTEELTHHIENCDSENISTSSKSSHTIQPNKPGWDYKLTPNQAPKHVTADIDESNIILSKRRANSAITSTFKNPLTWKEAMSHPDKTLWIEALKAELKNITSRGISVETSLPKGHKAVGNSVPFKRKFDNDGNLIKNKVRICAQGLSQKYGINYDNTFSPTGKFSLLQCLLATAANRNLEVHHMDLVAAFLNPVLKEEIYIKIPNFLSSHSSGKVWQLKKPLYCLKQSLRYWFLKLTKLLKSINLLPSKADPCMFLLDDPHWEFFVHIHVDDMTLASNDVIKFKKQIMQHFEMEDLSPANFVLGIKLLQNRASKKILLSQASYIKYLLDD